MNAVTNKPDFKPVVAHLHRSYLALSETFIYQYLTHLKRYHPIMLARRTENLVNFPFDALHSVSQQSRPTQAWNYLALKIFGHQPYFHRILRPLNPALLHAHFGSEGVNALALRRALNRPLLTTFYGKDLFQLPREVRWQNAYHWLFREGSGFIVLSHHMKQELRALGCAEEKIYLCHIGVDLSRFSFKPRIKSSSEPVRLLMCGRLIEKKGVIYALQALAQIVQDIPAVQLRIIGDGPLRVELETLISALHLQNHAKILGYLSHEAYAQEMAQAHIFLAPSVRAQDGDSEGTPTVILEAQAAGLPILATTHAGIPEIVGVKEPGFLAPERDVPALAANLRMMLHNPQRWSEWGETGRKYVEAEYEIHHVTETLETIYDAVGAKPQNRK